jgi:hypothetical protein
MMIQIELTEEELQLLKSVLPYAGRPGRSVLDEAVAKQTKSKIQSALNNSKRKEVTKGLKQIQLEKEYALDGYIIDFYRTFSGRLGITVAHPIGPEFVDIILSEDLSKCWHNADIRCV